jgi:hypothetical protein
MKSLAKPLAIVAACALLAVPRVAAAQTANPPSPSITTPDKVESRIGTLEFTDGMPSQGTLDKVYDHLDLSTTVYFAPERPSGVARGNWIQTIPGRGWFVLLRLYGPLEPFFDKTWQPSEIELVP